MVQVREREYNHGQIRHRHHIGEPVDQRHCRGGSIDYGLTEGIQLTELMEGAYRAHREGRTVSYPLD